MMKYVLLPLTVCALLVVAACSPSPQKLMTEANKYHENKKYDEASILYQKILVKDKTNADAYYKLGLNLLDQGASDQSKLRAALEALKRAFDLNPANIDAGSKVAQFYLAGYAANPQKNKELLDEATAIDNKILQQNPNSFDGLRIQAERAVVADHDLAKSEAIFAKANGIKPYDKTLIEPYSKVLLAEKKNDQAIALISDTLTHDKKWDGGYDLLSAIYASSKQNDKWEAILRQHLDADPNSAVAIIRYATFKLRVVNDFAGAEQLMKGLGNDPKTFPNGQFQLGEFYLAANKPDLAKAAYDQGKKDNPKDALAYDQRLVQLQAATGHMPDALSMARDLVDKNPKNIAINDLYADLLLRSDTHDTLAKTVDEIKKMADANPANTGLRLELGRAYFAANQRDKALATAQQVVTDEQKGQHPKVGIVVPAEILQAQIYQEKGDNAKALDLTTLSLNANPGNAAATIIRQRALVASRQYDKAEPELESLIGKAPQLSELHLLLGDTYLGTGKFDKATAQFEAASKMTPQDLRGTIGLQTVKLEQGHFVEAIQGIQDLVSKNPANPALRLELANFQRAAADRPQNFNQPVRKQLLEQAEDNYKQIVATNPSASAVWLDLGAVQRALGQTDAALASFQQAGTVDPKNAGAFLNKAMTLESINRNKEAIDEYNKVLSLAPDNFMALNNLAMLLADTGTSLDQAQTYAERARKGVPPNNPIAPAISDTLGYVYLQKNLSAQAADIFRQNVEQNPKNAAFRFHLAQALLKQGDKSGAKEQASKALQGEGASPDLQNKIRAFVGQIG